jgi:hypothetical protein
MIAIMIMIIIWDLHAFVRLSFMHFFIGPLLLLMLILLSYSELVPHKYLAMLAVLLTALIVVFFHETRYCRKMLQYRELPYHAVIEIVGVFIFLVLGNMLLSLEQKTTRRRRKTKR